MSTLQFVPGYYAKVRIDDEGNIVDVTDLEASDLPQHKHNLEDLVNDTVLEDRIIQVLSTFFANSGNSAVLFEFDKNTRTISADVNIDGETVIKNEYGQLTAAGGTIISNNPIVRPSDSGSSDSGSDDDSSEYDKPGHGSTAVIYPGSAELEEDFRQLTEKFEALEASVPEMLYRVMAEAFANSDATAVDFEWDPKTHTVSAEVNVDGISIAKDENGDLIATGSVAGSGENGNCASHAHLHDQIEDFDEAVINIFNDYSKNISIDLNKIIDGSTIKINEFGQLIAVRTATEKHTHSIKDIIDFEAQDPAAKQMISALGEDVDLSDGVLDFTNLNIGYSILAINKYLKEVVNKRLDELAKKIEALNVEKDNTVQSELSVASNAVCNKLIDKRDNLVKDVYYAKSVNLKLNYLPYGEGTIKLLKNGKVEAEGDIAALTAEGKSTGIFSVESCQLKNAFKAKVLSIDVASILTNEDLYTFQIVFETEAGTDTSNTIELYSTPYNNLQYAFEDTSAKHIVNGTTYYDYPKQLSYKVEIVDYDKYRFVPFSTGFVNGVLTGLAEGDDTKLDVKNLFGDSNIELKFIYDTEHSAIANDFQLSITQGGIVNDCLLPESSTPYTATFDIPFGKGYNALQLDVTDPNFKISFCKLQKGSRIADGSQIAETPSDSGVIVLDKTSYILTLGDSYDSGKEEMKLVIETNKSLNLNKLHFTPILSF